VEVQSSLINNAVRILKKLFFHLFLSIASAYAQSMGIKEDLIEWKNKRKLRSIKELSWLFQKKNIRCFLGIRQLPLIGISLVS